MPRDFYLEFDFQYEDISIECTLQQPFSYDNKQQATGSVEQMEIRCVLFPTCIMLTREGKSERLYHLKLKRLSDTAKKRLGKPLSPEEINKLLSSGTDALEKTIFSEKYMIFSEDFEDLNWTIPNLYQYLALNHTPTVIYQGERGFSFECDAFGVNTAPPKKGG